MGNSCSSGHGARQHPTRARQGGVVISRNRVMSEDRKQTKISVRELLQLLAGDLSPKDFLEDQGFEWKKGANPTLPNPFSQHLRAGELITDISLGRSELDDGHIVITFMSRARRPPVRST